MLGTDLFWSRIVFLFVFKQKTSYVMRISDWSSDVCSSDLRIAAEGRQRGPKRKAHAQPADQHLRLRARQNFSAGQCSQRFFRAAETTVHQQIGRASGRERVCQYV